MPGIDFVSHDLKKYTDNSELSIQIGLDGFSFCIHSAGSQRIMAFRHYAFPLSVSQEEMLNEIDETLVKDDLLNNPFRKVRVIIESRKSTLIPNPLFDMESLKTVLEFNQPVDEYDEIHFNEIPGCDSKLIFAFHTYTAGIVTDKFRSAAFFNQATPLLNYSFSDQVLQKDFILIQLNRNFFDIIVVDKGKLRLYNNFPYGNETDLTYYLLNTCRQMKLDAKTIPFFVTGKYMGENSLPPEVQKILGQVKYLDLPDLAEHQLLRDKISSQYFSLFYLSTCG